MSEQELPEYIWQHPTGPCWVDAWNGCYETLNEALENTGDGQGQPWILHRGEGCISQDEVDRRLEEQLDTYDVKVSLIVSANSYKHAVVQMVEWLRDSAGSAVNEVSHGSGPAKIIDAEYIDF